jgi:hypothetical protein
MEAAGSGHVAASMKKRTLFFKKRRGGCSAGVFTLAGQPFPAFGGGRETLRIPRAWIVSELVEINRENAQFSL